MAVDSPIAWRALLPAAFRYAFEECGKGLILAAIRASNAKSLQLTRHLGFEPVHRVADGWAEGEDMVLFEMRKAACRWLEKEAA